MTMANLLHHCSHIFCEYSRLCCILFFSGQGWGAGNVFFSSFYKSYVWRWKESVLVCFKLTSFKVSSNKPLALHGFPARSSATRVVISVFIFGSILKPYTLNVELSVILPINLSELSELYFWGSTACICHLLIVWIYLSIFTIKMYFVTYIFAQFRLAPKLKHIRWQKFLCRHSTMKGFHVSLFPVLDISSYADTL